MILTLSKVLSQISRFLPSSCQKRGHGVTILHPGRFFWADTSFFAKPLTHFFSLGLNCGEVGCLVLLNTQYIACCCCHRFYRMQWSHWSFGGKSTAFLLHPIPLASWQMTRSTKMHWYLSFSKLVQLKQEFIRQRVLSVVENWYY